MARMRTIQQTIQYIRQSDHDTCVSEWWLRQMVKAGKIKHHRAGNKYLIDLDALEEFLKTPPDESGPMEVGEYGKLRRVKI